MKRTIDWIVLNLLAITGNVYVSKKDSDCYPDRVVIDPSVLIVYSLVWMFISIFLGSIFEVSNIPEMRELTKSEKFWIGTNYAILGYAVTYIVGCLFRWFCTDCYSKYKVNGTTRNNYRCVPFISYKELYNIERDVKREERQLKQSKNKDDLDELERNLRVLVNK